MKGTRLFPEGEVTVVLYRFCRADFGTERDFPWSQERWQGLIQSTLTQWNEAGTKPSHNGKRRRFCMGILVDIFDEERRHLSERIEARPGKPNCRGRAFCR